MPSRKKAAVSKPAKKRPGPAKTGSGRVSRAATTRRPRAAGGRAAGSQPIDLKSVTAKASNGEPHLAADSGLTRKDIEAFEQALLQKRAQLLGDVTTLHNDALGKNRQDAAGDLSSMPIHMADLGTDNYEQEFTLGLLEGERAVLREIDDALERIRKGSYGLCLATGKPIGKARLKATPWAKYSYEYTLAQERGRARRI